MTQPVFTMKMKVWVYPGEAAWHFVTLPKKQANEIKKLYSGLEAGFGSFPVAVEIGKTKWQTSIFPDTKAGSFLLPLKAKVRKDENIQKGSTVKVSLSVRV